MFTRFVLSGPTVADHNSFEPVVVAEASAGNSSHPPGYSKVTPFSSYVPVPSCSSSDPEVTSGSSSELPPQATVTRASASRAAARTFLFRMSLLQVVSSDQHRLPEGRIQGPGAGLRGPRRR